MGCGAFKIHTVFAIGSIPEEMIRSAANRERVRVLHRLPDETSAFMSDNDDYKSIAGAVDDRIRLMSMMLMYDFTMVICEESFFNEVLFTVFKEQWAGEFSSHVLLVKRGDKYSEVEFSRDFPPAYRDRTDPTPLFDLLLK